ncbi:SAM-dependent methyltransferase [Pseudomonas sp. SORGH_AS 211]|uniref:class I SAM-dependent methyltransferase n=1 Tax=Pseudomonas sp. SORGH_AS_0211 TaxID=3041796 RepID=UPI0028562927|nr:class I SAM-dependent methyltransferase [Pseudomonas sp. SORGH_AS_0211]MDR6177811.1 SAM-dependent methyltransferase [Pseudomonas sp. SORGH_AS_0211]
MIGSARVTSGRRGERTQSSSAAVVRADFEACQAGAAVYSPLTLRLYDAWVLGLSNRYAWGCPTAEVLLPFFRRQVGRRHLEVGVGTGYYLAKAELPADTEVTLLDLNPVSLAAAQGRFGRPARTLRHDVLEPLEPTVGPFDSIALYYLLHCLPGSLAQKGRVFAQLAPVLAPGGVLFGATILGDTAGHNRFGQRLMALYNRKGIFGNAHDTLADLERELRRHFARIELRQVGRVALFSAR